MRCNTYWEEEKPYVLPLPAVPFEAVIWSIANVPNYYRAFDGRSKHSVPYNLIGEKVDHAIGVDWNESKEYIVDSCPIILAKGPRSSRGKVARELCKKSYNSSRKEWYYGMKLHAVVARRPGCLPLPLSLMASGAAQHDLPAAKQILEDHIVLKRGCLYADKAYIDAASNHFFF